MGISSELIGVIIGALIAGFFTLIQAFKNNKLQYVTKERSEWRKTIRKFMKDIEKSNYNDIWEVLADLKGNINSYGIYPSGCYPQDCKLDYQKDEHIWKIIDEIENCKNEKNFKSLKNKLIIYLSLLLKFEWEKHKVEVKANWLIVFSIGMFVFINLFTFISNNKHLNLSSLEKNDNIQFFLLSTSIYVIYLLLLIINKYRVKGAKWYKGQGLSFATALFTCISILIYCFEKNSILNFTEFINVCIYVIGIMFCYLLAVLSINCNLIYFLEYDEKIKQLTHNEKIYVYYKPNFFIWEIFCDIYRSIKIDSVFNKYNIGINQEVLKKDFSINIVLSQTNCVIGNLFTILGFWSFIKYKIKYMTKKQPILEFIKEKPKRCKIIIVYKRYEKEYYCISNRKSDWEKFLKKIYEKNYNI